jgi:hypothetical protein
MTVGTGFFGGSSLGENLEPKHLVNWTRLAYNADAKEPMADFTGLDPWHTPAGPVPAYPIASNAADAPLLTPPPSPISRGTEPASANDELREEIRRLIVEELHEIIRG